MSTKVLKHTEYVPEKSSLNRICSDSLCSEHPAGETYTAMTAVLFGSQERGQNRDRSCSPSHRHMSNTLGRLDRETHWSEFQFHTYNQGPPMHLSTVHRLY